MPERGRAAPGKRECIRRVSLTTELCIARDGSVCVAASILHTRRFYSKMISGCGRGKGEKEGRGEEGRRGERRRERGSGVAKVVRAP